MPCKTIEDLVAAHLYAIGFVHDNEEVEKIEFGEVNEQGNVPIRFTVKKEVRSVGA